MAIVAFVPQTTQTALCVVVNTEYNRRVTNRGLPWLNWHTLWRIHATFFQFAGGSLQDAQAQLGHSKMSTTLEIYTLAIPAQ